MLLRLTLLCPHAGILPCSAWQAGAAPTLTRILTLPKQLPVSQLAGEKDRLPAACHAAVPVAVPSSAAGPLVCVCRSCS